MAHMLLKEVKKIKTNDICNISIILLSVVIKFEVVYAGETFRCAKDGTTLYNGIVSDAGDCKGTDFSHSKNLIIRGCTAEEKKWLLS